MTTLIDRLKEIVQRLPDSPGVYRFYNEDDILIYVGKAKNIKKRVTSYFSKSTGVNRKTLKLVSEITASTSQYLIQNSTHCCWRIISSNKTSPSTTFS